MKRIDTILIVGIFLLFLLYEPISLCENSIREDILSLPSVVSVRSIDKSAGFNEAYEVFIDQPIDHSNPDGEHFNQKIYISHIDEKLPVVIELDGYSMPNSRYNELADILDCNIIQVEHRYFGESIPDNVQWEYLTIEQAAKDHHHIIELFKKIYKGKWVSTGISKGGQTTIFHRYYFNDDVDVSVPYVAPLNIAEEDPRIYHFLDNVGTDECREKIASFQREVLIRADELISLFTKEAEKLGYTYSLGNSRYVFEYIVLEYEFAFWQWQNNNCDEIPASTASNEELFLHLKRNSSLEYFSDQGISPISPFFYQAYSEIGYYGYDITNVKDLLVEVKEPSSKVFIPVDSNPSFDPAIMQDINKWVQKHGNNMLFVYGGNDTWSASAVELTGETNAIKMVKKNGSHRTRIRNFEGEELKLIYSTLEDWLDIEIKRNDQFFN